LKDRTKSRHMTPFVVVETKMPSMDGMLATSRLSGEPIDMVHARAMKMARTPTFKNNHYTVMRSVQEGVWGTMWHLAIRRNDGKPITQYWEDFQAIKNELCGPDTEAVELYPLEARRIPNEGHHLFCFVEKGKMFPIGVDPRGAPK